MDEVAKYQYIIYITRNVQKMLLENINHVRFSFHRLTVFAHFAYTDRILFDKKYQFIFIFKNPLAQFPLLLRFDIPASII